MKKSKILFPLLAASILLIAAGCNKSTPVPAMQNDQGMQQTPSSSDSMSSDSGNDSGNMSGDQMNSGDTGVKPSGSMPTKDNAGSMSTDGSMPNNK